MADYFNNNDSNMVVEPDAVQQPVSGVEGNPNAYSASVSNAYPTGQYTTDFNPNSTFWGNDAGGGGGNTFDPSSGQYVKDTSPEAVARTTEAWANAHETGGMSDALKKVLGFANDNKSNPLLMMGMMGLANAQKAQNEREAVLHREQTARDIIAANSASVSGIAPRQGIIQAALKRLNGQAVFQPNGRIAR